MKNHISKLRTHYEGEVLDEKLVAQFPTNQFKKWFEEALANKVMEPNAISLATADKNGIPSVRVVLLKDFDEKGFTFYTNYNSQKGQEIEQNPFASILFFWPQLHRQIRINGLLEQVEPEISETYFKERPRGSQISAWVSAQSQEIDNKIILEEKYKDFEEKCKNKEIPYPAFWGGYRLKPSIFEFWQGQPNRLHDRIQYKLNSEENTWAIKRLAP